MVLRFITLELPELPELDDLGMPENMKDFVMLWRPIS
jgi:Tfp pilus assembly ATPase PilU